MGWRSGLLDKAGRCASSLWRLSRGHSLELQIAPAVGHDSAGRQEASEWARGRLVQQFEIGPFLKEEAQHAWQVFLAFSEVDDSYLSV